MNELQKFMYTNKEIRVVIKEGEPWFVAADVCQVLEIRNNRDAIARLDDDEKMTVGLTDTHSGQRGGAQEISVVNEPGLYTLILGSRKKEAKAFKRWVIHDVSTSIKDVRSLDTPGFKHRMCSENVWFP